MRITTDIIRPHQLHLLRTFIAKLGHLHIIIGGIGTFKSSTIIMALYHHCIRFPGQEIIIAGQSYAHVRSAFINEFVEQVPKNEYKMRHVDGLPQINLDKHDSVLYIRQFNHPTPKAAYESIHGVNLSGFYLVQPDVLHDDGFYFSAINERIRKFGTVEARQHFRVMDTNGPDSGHWLDNFYLNQSSPQYSGIREKVNIFHIVTTPETSCYSKQFLESEQKKLPRHLFIRRIYGFSARAEGLVYPEYEISKRKSPDEIAEYWIGIDPGEGEHPFAIVFVGKDINGNYFVIDEIKSKSKSLEYAIQATDRKIEQWGKEKFRFAVFDWKSETWRQYYKRDSIYVKETKLPWHNRNSYYQITDGIILLYQGFVTKSISVCDNCKETLKDLNNYHYTDRGDTPDKKSYDPHMLDALRYLYIRLQGRIKEVSIL